MNNLFWLTIVLFVVAAVLRSELFFYLLYVVVGLQVLARLWTRRSATRLVWQRVAPPAAFPGEPLTVALEVTNTSLLPMPWLSLHESVPAALRSPPMIHEVLSLGAGERRTLTYTLEGRQRGYYRLGPLTLRTGDVLGLGERTIHGSTSDGLTIYPTILPLHELGLPASLPFGTLTAQQRLFTDPARPAGVRPYQPSDGVRRIDWKSTARAGTPQVRRYQPAIALETLIALAFAREEYADRHAFDQMERALVAAASIAAYLSGRAQPTGFVTSGNDAATGALAASIPTGTGRAHLISILSTLGRLEATPRGNITQQLHGTAAQLGWGSTVVVITGRRDAELLDMLVPLKRRGLNLALIMTDADPEALARPRAYGLTTYGLFRDGRPQG